MRKLYATLVAMSFVAAASAPAGAANLLNTTFPGLQTFTAAGPVRLFPSGSFFQAFTTTQAETVMVSFSAGCSVTGTGVQQLRLAIFIDSKAIYPTNRSNFVFCSAIGTPNGQDARASFSLVTGVEVGSGNHNVTVNATPTTGSKAILTNLTMQVWD